MSHKDENVFFRNQLGRRFMLKSYVEVSLSDVKIKQDEVWNQNLPEHSLDRK